MNFDFPETVAKLIFERWADASVPNYQASARPSLDVLVALLNNCFFASLKREEDRATQFDLAFCHKSDLTEVAFRYSEFTKLCTLIPFENRELSVNELVRLAPACDPDKTVILSDYDGKTNQVYLWGIADTGGRSSGTDIRLTELRIRVYGPGEIKVSLLDRLVCIYKNGKIIDPERALINTGRVYGFFKNTSLNLCKEVTVGVGKPQQSDERVHERDCRAISYLLVLQEIAERMQRLKHGGCVLIVPEDTSNDKLANLDIKYPCRDQTVWNCLRGKLILHDKFYAALSGAGKGEQDAEVVESLHSQLEDVENGLRDALDMLVRFTAVDGAVLITRKLELLGFGAVVQLPGVVEYKVNKCEDRNATKVTEFPIKSHGTRHRSAFEFCYRNAPSVAIIVSQDGGVKMVMRVGDNICFWENSPFDGSTEI
jgi:hypothetical protein